MDTRMTAMTLGVADVARAVAFYVSLGFTAHTVMDDVAFLPMNGLVLCLYSGLAQDGGVEARGPGLTAMAHNVRERLEVDAVLDHAATIGATVTRPAHDTDWGGRSGYFADPDGHLWEIAWNPFWPLDAEGRVSLPD